MSLCRYSDISDGQESSIPLAWRSRFRRPMDPLAGMSADTIELAHGFGLTVCAKGVENVDDLRTLIDLGCHSAQGFLFARPPHPCGMLQLLPGDDPGPIVIFEAEKNGAQARMLSVGQHRVS
jgi:hypothetical protein